jgi:AraC family transcriptional regulator
VSRFHLAHAFGEATGLSVIEYRRARRLTEAAYALAAGASDILGVALDSGYASHEAFSRAFKAQFGKTPEEVRKSESIAGLKLVDAIRHLESKAMTLREPRIETVGELKFVGLSEHVPYGAMQNIAGQWLRFMQNHYGEIENRLPEPPVGVTTASDDAGIQYACAAGVGAFGKLPNGLIAITLAPATYAVFAHDGHVTEIRHTYEAIWNDWFPKSGRAPAEAPGFERHNATFDPRTGNGGCTIWLPLR